MKLTNFPAAQTALPIMEINGELKVLVPYFRDRNKHTQEKKELCGRHHMETFRNQPVLNSGALGDYSPPYLKAETQVHSGARLVC
jgi:hypothetical protein